MLNPLESNLQNSYFITVANVEVFYFMEMR